MATARPGGFQGLKHTQRKELELLLAPAPTQQTVVSATPNSPRAGAGTPAHHPSGTGSGDRRCPRPWGDPCGATSAQGSQPSCIPKNLSASITQGNRNLAGRQGMGLSVPASIQPLGEQVSTPKKQVLCLRTRMRHLPGLGPCRIPAPFPAGCLWGCPTLLRALQGARAVLTILDMAPRDCHITTLHVASRCSFHSSSSCTGRTPELLLPNTGTGGQPAHPPSLGWRSWGKLDKDRPLPVPCRGPRPSVPCITLPTWAALQVTPCPGCPS